MLDLGWSELLVIGIVALIVVGPKDLPRMLRTLGRYAAKAKSVAREFQRSMDEAARQADIDELRDVKKDLDKDVSALREQQYKMQREMGRSITDKPKGKAAPEPRPAEGASAKAEARPAEEPAPAPSANQPAVPPDEAGPEPRKASGA